MPKKKKTKMRQKSHNSMLHVDRFENLVRLVKYEWCKRQQKLNEINANGWWKEKWLQQIWTTTTKKVNFLALIVQKWATNSRFHKTFHIIQHIKYISLKVFGRFFHLYKIHSPFVWKKNWHTQPYTHFKAYLFAHFFSHIYLHPNVDHRRIHYYGYAEKRMNKFIARQKTLSFKMFLPIFRRRRQLTKTYNFFSYGDSFFFLLRLIHSKIIFSCMQIYQNKTKMRARLRTMKFIAF